MSDLSDFADGLQDEVVSDMAESYFGSRKALEDKIEGFQLLVEELRPVGARVQAVAVQLFALLPDDEAATAFFRAVDVQPLTHPDGLEPLPFFENRPFAFTAKGRYERCLLAVYDALQRVTNEYRNGIYFDDPDQPGRKRLTTHYLLLESLAAHINREVDKVNSEMSPSGTLRYVKKMDPLQMEKENILGEGCLQDGCSLDKDLAFSPIDFESFGLPVMQGLPPLKEVEDGVRRFCRDNYPSRKDAMDQAVQRLCGGV